jgi:hypothetical protein
LFKLKTKPQALTLLIVFVTKCQLQRKFKFPGYLHKIAMLIGAFSFSPLGTTFVFIIEKCSPFQDNEGLLGSKIFFARYNPMKEIESEKDLVVLNFLTVS